MRCRRATFASFALFGGLAWAAPGPAVAGHHGQTYTYNGQAGAWSGAYPACCVQPAPVAYAPQYAPQPAHYAPQPAYAAPQPVAYPQRPAAWRVMPARR